MRPLFKTLGRWPAWEQAALRHGLAAWVADELSAEGKPVPSAITEAARSQVANGARLKRLSLAVVDALAAAQVTPVLLKGYGLASRLFPEQPFARPSSDVDVLVLPEEVPTAEPALAKLGLRLGSVPGVEDVFEEHHHRPWSGPPGLVELHFRLFSGFGGGVFDDRAIRSRTMSGTLDGRQILWLAPEDEFLYLATHAANHSFLRISWLVDLERYLSIAPHLDWGVMRDRARAAGFEVPMATTMHLLERLLDVRLPPAARDAFPHSLLRRRLDRRLFSGPRVVNATWSNDRLSSFLLRLYLSDSLGQGGRHLLDGARRYLRQRRGV